MAFADNLKTSRASAGFTGREFADKLGIPYATLAGYENKGREPKYETLVKMADLLGVSTDNLLGRKESILMPWAEVKKIILGCGYDVKEISDAYGDNLVAIHGKIPKDGGFEEIHQVFDRARLSIYVTDERDKIMADIHPLLVRVVKDSLQRWIEQK